VNETIYQINTLAKFFKIYLTDLKSLMGETDGNCFILIAGMHHYLYVSFYLILKVADNDEIISTSPLLLKMIDALINKKAPPPNMSTVVKPLEKFEYVHEFERITNSIVAACIEAVKDGRQGEVY
jgi:hypothetical protein